MTLDDDPVVSIAVCAVVLLLLAALFGAFGCLTDCLGTQDPREALTARPRAEMDTTPWI